MGVSLSIKEVPEALAQRLRERATANHRSLQRELMAIIEAAAVAPAGGGDAAWPLREEPPSYAPPARSREGAAPAAADDGLLAELDAIVAGSRFGSAPLLTREQTHDRALARELDFDAREAELEAARTRRRTTR